MTGKSRKFIQKLRKKYRLTVSDQKNFKEIYSAPISKLKFILYNLSIIILSATIILLIIFYTPAKQLVPGYHSNKLRKLIVYNSLMVDSLKQEIEYRDNYLLNIRKIIKGEIIEDTSLQKRNIQEIPMLPMQDDSIFDNLIVPEKYKFAYSNNANDVKKMAHINFFTPLRGVVVNKFKATPYHFGIDIVGKDNSYISAVLDGTVIFAEWSVSTGYVVQIQHNYNMISIYKHNSEILVKQGTHVKAGDVIAVMGNEGEYTSGPHLHFELWQNGVPLDPEAYIIF